MDIFHTQIYNDIRDIIEKTDDVHGDSLSIMLVAAHVSFGGDMEHILARPRSNPF